MYAAGRSARSRISWPVQQLIRGGINSWTGEKLQQAPRRLDLLMTSFWNVSVHMCMTIIHFGGFCEVKVLAFQISSFLPFFSVQSSLRALTLFLRNRWFAVDSATISTCSLDGNEHISIQLPGWCTLQLTKIIANSNTESTIAINYTNPQTPRLTNIWSCTINQFVIL